MPLPIFRCAICQNAYDSKYACKDCRNDPANAEWIAQLADDRSVYEPVEEKFTATPLEQKIAREMFYGRCASPHAIAKKLGCPKEAVRWFMTRVASTGRTYRRGEEVADMHEAPPCAGHVWEPHQHSDYETVGIYRCSSCGWWGKRNLRTSRIVPLAFKRGTGDARRGRLPRYTRPQPTVQSRFALSDEAHTAMFAAMGAAGDEE